MVSSSIQFGSTTIQTRGLPGRTAIPLLILVSDVSGSDEEPARSAPRRQSRCRTAFKRSLKSSLSTLLLLSAPGQAVALNWTRDGSNLEQHTYNPVELRPASPGSEC
jgi:hypothetical protein